MEFVHDGGDIGTWESDLPSGVVKWSETLERLHGMKPGTFEGTREAFLESVHPADRQQVLAGVTRALQKQSELRLHYRVTLPDGAIRWLAGVGRMVYDDHGEPVRMVGMAMDITSQKLLGDQLLQARHMEALENIAGRVAHDFNNFLAVIVGYCEMFTKRFAADTETAEDLEEVRHTTDSATALTGQLLAFSRRHTLESKALNLNDSVRGVQNTLRRLIGNNVEVHVRLDENLMHVSADPLQIERMLVNLATNARDAMPSGGILTISTRNAVLDASLGRPFDAAPGPYVVLSVSDDGCGISPDVQPRIFEPFFTTRKRGCGLGLGLATVDGIVKQSAGHVAVSSEIGTGTVFHIYLPAIRVASKSSTQERNGVANDLLGTETILVIEDDRGLRVLNERVLRSYGYSVLVAKDAAEARHICNTAQSPIHAALIDVMMPGENGATLGRWIAEQRPNTRIIYVSGYTKESVAREGLLSADAPFLQKPFAPVELARKVRSVLSA
jgi:PAS domain S-box-containing protein